MSKMTPEKALEASIARWEKIATGELYSGGITTCALCDLFWADACKGCPVRERGGAPYCEGTPYESFLETWRAYCTANGLSDLQSSHARAKTPELVKLAKAQVNFLKSLRPKKRKAKP